MNRLIPLCLALAALPALSQTRARSQAFASDFQTLPVVANVTGIGNAQFQSYVTLYDANGTARNATISLGAGELKTYTNFLQAVFNYAGGGAATFRSADPAHRFVAATEYAP